MSMEFCRAFYRFLLLSTFSLSVWLLFTTLWTGKEPQMSVWTTVFDMSVVRLVQLSGS